MKQPFKTTLLLLATLLVTVLLGQTQKPTAAKTTGTVNYFTYLPTILNRYDSQFPGPLFGMQVYSSTDPTNKYYNALINSQTSWVRSRVRWDLVEPTNVAPSNYNWNTADANLAVAQPANGGLNVIAVIDFVPNWAQQIPGAVSGPIKSANLNDFAEFVQATVERYDGDGFNDAPGQPIIKHWELINEPDGTPNRWGFYGAEYAQMLKVAYPAIKAADPNAQVLFGGIAYDSFIENGGPFNKSFLDDVLAAGGGDYFDVMNFHMYPLFAPYWGEDMTGLPGKTDAIRAKLAEYGLEKPIVVTEAGWHNSTNIEPVSTGDDEQIALLVQLVTHSFAKDIKVMIWFMLYDPGDFLPDFGLVTNGNPPVEKAAFSAYTTAVSMLKNAQYAANVTPTHTGTPYLEAHQFTTPQGTLYIAWMSPFDTTTTATFSVPATSVTVFDARGNTIGTFTDGNGDGKVDVTIANDPVYIRVNQ
ncbi:MAG: hypothetical protein Kow0080_30950 [Candidatus Promineifilaceae bacterium]